VALVAAGLKKLHPALEICGRNLW